MELERTHRIVRVTWMGDITLAVLKEGFSKVRTFATDRNLRGGISDFTQSQSFKLSSNDIYTLSQEAPVFPTDVPRVTVSGADHIFGMARMYELVTEERQRGIYVVRTMEEAYALLNLTNPVFEQVELS